VKNGSFFKLVHICLTSTGTTLATKLSAGSGAPELGANHRAILGRRVGIPSNDTGRPGGFDEAVIGGPGQHMEEKCAATALASPD
jgi:hypothetical protein